jgi:ATP-binding cassette subfamily F protein 3
MITLSNISLAHAGHIVYDTVSVSFRPTDKVGLTGINGAGKSTLLKLITGVMQADSGTISIPTNALIGYLGQDGAPDTHRTVYEETAVVFSDILKSNERIAVITDELSHRTDHESEEYLALVHELSDCTDQFFRSGGQTLRADIERVLKGLGFEQSDLDRPLMEFSGGWRMRVELAKLLLQQCDYLLLDEPTNHLDIDSLRWLEQYLQSWTKALVLISHDRAFLDAITKRTVEVSFGKLYDYPFPYSRYVEERALRREQQLRAFENQQKAIADTERFIERFRYKATKAVQVQSRIKQLDKIDRIHVEDEDTSAIEFRFPPAPRSGRVVIETQNLNKHYGNAHVLRNIHFAMERGEKIAFVGRNGEGKSTLSKIIAGVESYEGVLTIGHNVSIGYYAQHQAELLDPSLSVFDVIDRTAQGDIRVYMRDILGAFLFTGDTVNKKVRVLSGGEKSRLALAKLLLEPCNLLVLDEPTNHLDMRSKDVLKQALADFEGAVLVVSHDREFLTGLVTKVVEFKHGVLREYPGDMAEYLATKEREEARLVEQERADILSVRQQEADTSLQPTNAQAQREASKQRQREERRIKRRIEEVEESISTHERTVQDCETLMSAADFYTRSDMQSITTRYQTAKEHLDSHMNEWSMLHAELEELV